jgi:4-alpha-glucanotransferase
VDPQSSVSEQDWGVQQHYEDASGRVRAAPRETVESVLRTLRATTHSPPGGPLIVAAGTRRPVDGMVQIQTEDGRSIPCSGVLPADLPIGYHQLVDTRDRGTTLIVSPRRCPLPARSKSFGFAVQLYAARSRSSWGIGDLADLQTLGSWSASVGASLLLLNPLHAPLPTDPQRASPYSPSTRRYHNPLYINIERVPGVERIASDVGLVSDEAVGLLADRRIDRDAVFRLKMRVLEQLWDVIRDEAQIDAFTEANPSLIRYATFCALVERHGAQWRAWPEDVRHPDAAGVARFRRDNERRVRFHVWLQWLLDLQLGVASQSTGLMQDLAVGFDPGGADAWEWQDIVADGFTIGAPPDEFNTLGQDWGLAPFDPWRLRAAGYRPFIETIRASLRHATSLRLDHVMGLFRLFWIPEGAAPASGVYVRYPASDLLDILALETARAGAFVVGEDLGTIETETREELAARDVLSYRLLWFEENDPATYPVKALAGVTTHDLPTVAGLWDGSDLDAQRRLGLHPNEKATVAILRRVRTAVGLAESAPIDEVVVALYAWLARAPSMMLTATLDDMLAVRERPNLPGTVDQWPNWSLALPVPIEELVRSSLAARVAAELRRA